MPSYCPTERELQVLRAFVQFGTIAAAAESLFLSSGAVDWHLDKLRKKTGLHYSPQLVAWAALQGHLDGIGF